MTKKQLTEMSDTELGQTVRELSVGILEQRLPMVAAARAFAQSCVDMDAMGRSTEFSIALPNKAVNPLQKDLPDGKWQVTAHRVK